ncbi:cysteine ABC transporter permease [Enterococcus florum]|uniref:Cysteine ABC transporter permease n=1 Tax=Enterococcus florum TaxID=2480627 RepID=A0A4P5P7X3_9ENTE|nr:amino acid ABC transporter permease [Enterococcus florum]GCF94067.1 cysteine ABC transporter permease [Enterococcus florum]
MNRFFDWQLVINYFPRLLEALPTTLLIVGVASLIGLLLGALLAFFRIEKVPIFHQLSAVFVSFIRGTPILVQLYVVYYGVPELLQVVGVDVSNLDKLIFIYITYGLNTAAFQSETIRAAILSVPQTQYEASTACGLTRTQTYLKVILPQAVRVAIPSFGTTTIALLQDTSLAFTIGVLDVVGTAKSIGSVTFHTLEGYIGAAVLFILLSILLERIFALLEDQLNYGNQNFKLRVPQLFLLLKRKKFVS